jgi:hypothetical protein
VGRSEGSQVCLLSVTTLAICDSRDCVLFGFSFSVGGDFLATRRCGL